MKASSLLFLVGELDMTGSTFSVSMTSKVDGTARLLEDGRILEAFRSVESVPLAFSPSGELCAIKPVSVSCVL